MRPIWRRKTRKDTTRQRKTFGTALRRKFSENKLVHSLTLVVECLNGLRAAAPLRKNNAGTGVGTTALDRIKRSQWDRIHLIFPGVTTQFRRPPPAVYFKCFPSSALSWFSCRRRTPLLQCSRSLICGWLSHDEVNNAHFFLTDLSLTTITVKSSYRTATPLLWKCDGNCPGENSRTEKVDRVESISEPANGT